MSDPVERHEEESGDEEVRRDVEDASSIPLPSNAGEHRDANKGDDGEDEDSDSAQESDNEEDPQPARPSVSVEDLGKELKARLHFGHSPNSVEPETPGGDLDVYQQDGDDQLPHNQGRPSIPWTDEQLAETLARDQALLRLEAEEELDRPPNPTPESEEEETEEGLELIDQFGTLRCRKTGVAKVYLEEGEFIMIQPNMVEDFLGGPNESPDDSWVTLTKDDYRMLEGEIEGDSSDLKRKLDRLVNNGFENLLFSYEFISPRHLIPKLRGTKGNQHFLILLNEMRRNLLLSKIRFRASRVKGNAATQMEWINIADLARGGNLTSLAVDLRRSAEISQKLFSDALGEFRTLSKNILEKATQLHEGQEHLLASLRESRNAINTWREAMIGMPSKPIETQNRAYYDSLVQVPAAPNPPKAKDRDKTKAKVPKETPRSQEEPHPREREPVQPVQEKFHQQSQPKPSPIKKKPTTPQKVIIPTEEGDSDSDDGIDWGKYKEERKRQAEEAKARKIQDEEKRRRLRDSLKAKEREVPPKQVESTEETIPRDTGDQGAAAVVDDGYSLPPPTEPRPSPIKERSKPSKKHKTVEFAEPAESPRKSSTGTRSKSKVIPENVPIGRQLNEYVGDRVRGLLKNPIPSSIKTEGYVPLSIAQTVNAINKRATGKKSEGHRGGSRNLDEDWNN